MLVLIMYFVLTSLRFIRGIRGINSFLDLENKTHNDVEQ